MTSAGGLHCVQVNTRGLGTTLLAYERVRENRKNGEGIMIDRSEQAEGLEPRDFALRIATVLALVFGTLAFLLVV